MVDALIVPSREILWGAMTPDPMQERVIELASSHRVIVLTGPPGTGKTWVTKALLSLYEHNALSVLCLAPTGKAARRMTEQTGRPASTIHRALATMGDADYLSADVIATDESSMLDVELLHRLISSTNPKSRLVFVGDMEQISPIGPGRPFADMIYSGRVPTVRLTKIFRQASESRIPYVAQDINAGHSPDWTVKGSDANFIEVKENKAIRDEKERRGEQLSRIQQMIVSMVTEIIPARKGIPVERIQVLCAQKNREIGVEALNAILQEKLNPLNGRDQVFGGSGYMLRTGDRVMQTKNNYEFGPGPGQGVMNGEVGSVVKLTRDGLKADELNEAIDSGVLTSSANENRKSKSKGRKSDPILMIVDFGDKRVGYTKIECRDIQLAYALSVHKCVDPLTLVETSSGLKTIRDLTSTDQFIAAPKGARGWSSKIPETQRKMLRIETQDGYEIRVTEDHGLDSWSGDNYQRVEALNLKEGDFLRLRLGSTVSAEVTPKLPKAPIQADFARSPQEYPVPEVMSEDFAEFLGLMVADGVTAERLFRLVKEHRDVAERFADLVEKLFGRRWPVLEDRVKNAYCCEAGSVFLRRWLDNFGGIHPHDKYVPQVILESPDQFQRAFLRGLFEDGTVNLKVNKNKTTTKIDHIEWSNVTESVVRTAQLMLLRFGIVSAVNLRRSFLHATGKEYFQYRLYIYGKYCHKFRDEIGFVAAFKNDRLALPAGDQTRYWIPASAKEFTELYKVQKVITSGTAQYSSKKGTLTRHVADKAVEDLGSNEVIRGEIVDRLGWHHSRIKTIESYVGLATCIEVPDGNQFLQNGFSGWNCQGSQFQAIVMPIHSAHQWMLTRKLVYTAATRAESFLLFVGEPNTLSKAARNPKGDERRTSLCERLTGHASVPPVTPIDSTEDEIDAVAARVQAQEIRKPIARVEKALELGQRDQELKSLFTGAFNAPSDPPQASSDKPDVTSSIIDAYFAQRQGAQSNDKPAPNASDGERQSILDGHYMVRLDDNQLTFRVSTAIKGKMEGKVIVEQIEGRNVSSGVAFVSDNREYINLWSRLKSNIVLTQAIQKIMDDPKACAEEYALSTARCYVCGRKLKTPDSVKRGRGPECAKRGY